MKLDADVIVGDLYDFFCEDLLFHDELSVQIDVSLDTFTSEVQWLRFFPLYHVDYLTSDS